MVDARIERTCLGNGDGLSVLVADDDHLDVGALAIVHKGDRGHVDGPYVPGVVSLGDEAVVERKAAADVHVAVARLEHHRHVLDRADAALEQTHAELRVELLEGDLVRGHRRHGLVRLARLGRVRRHGVVVRRLGRRRLRNARLAVAGRGLGLARRRVHDRVAATGSHSACLAVVVRRGDVGRCDAVDAYAAALAASGRISGDSRKTVSEERDQGAPFASVLTVAKVKLSLRWTTYGQPPWRCRIARGRSPSRQLFTERAESKVSVGSSTVDAQDEQKRTVLEGIRLTRPAVLDHEWDAVIELQADLLGSTRLEANGCGAVAYWAKRKNS
ncbi:hypothetical protein L1887_59907 [Cichorium endivia]|nr:hypothetical protein L1887_59907 [Cichorium endivia]